MKKISHKQLEACRISPKIWALSQGGGGFATFGYKQALSNAICIFHRLGALKPAETRLEEMIEKNFTNAKKSDAIRQALISYAKWFATSGVVVADTNITLNFPAAGLWHLGGNVARIDVTDVGYRAVLFEAFDSNWKSQLRMPLIQMAIAEQYGRPPAEVRVGIHDIDGNSTVEAGYQKSKRIAALSEFQAIGTIVQSVLPPI